MDQVGLESNERDAIRRAAAILKERFPVERVVLFGSRARGTGTGESDVDLLVLTHGPLDQSTKADMVGAVFDLQLEHGVVLSLLAADLDEWERGYFRVLPIHDQVEREGVLA